MTRTGCLRVAVAGASGRMGKCVVAALDHSTTMTLTGGLVRSDSRAAGKDLGEIAGMRAIGVAAATTPERAFDGAAVVVDFSLAEASDSVIGHCAGHGLALVTGVTGRTTDQAALLRAAAAKIPVVAAANMSVGVNLMLRLARMSASVLSDYDAEIIETHHRHKIDAPSGTALAIGQAVADGRGDAHRAEIGRRPGDKARQPGAIGYASIRAGDVVGEHTLLLAGAGERVELTHRVTDRAAFAAGALHAAVWVAGREPGLYGMDQVLADDIG